MTIVRVEATCPSCFRLYRLMLDPSQLRRMRKTAVCGRCGERFDVVERLRRTSGPSAALVPPPPPPPPRPARPARPAPPPPPTRRASPPPAPEERPRRRRTPRYTLPMTAAVVPDAMSEPREAETPRAEGARLSRPRFTPAGAWAVSPPEPVAEGTAIGAMILQTQVIGERPPPIVEVNPERRPTPTSVEAPPSEPPGPASDAPRFIAEPSPSQPGVSWGSLALTSLDALCGDEPPVHHSVARILDGR